MPRSIDDLKTGFIYCAHGGGAYKGAMNSNVQEAIDYWLAKGIRFLEINVAAAGKRVVLLHSLEPNELIKYEIYETPKPPLTYEWFLSQKLFPVSTRGLTPLSLNQLINYLIDYNDLIIMLDLWNQEYDDINIILGELKEIIGDNCDFYNRLIVEIYSWDMFKSVRDVDEHISIMWGCMPEMSETITFKDLLKENINMVSCPRTYIKTHLNQCKNFVENDLVLFSYSETNLHTKELKELGVKINNVDVVFYGLRILYELPLYYFYRIKSYLAHGYVMYKYYGVKRFCVSIANKFRIK